MVDLGDVPEGAEQYKRRPCLIVSRDDVGALPLRVVVPFTSWQGHFEGAPWLVKIPATPGNGLSNDSAADTFQIRSVSEKRFKRRLGVISGLLMDSIVDAIIGGISDDD
jgi:mRNA interferase MazF